MDSNNSSNNNKNCLKDKWIKTLNIRIIINILKMIYYEQHLIAFINGINGNNMYYLL